MAALMRLSRCSSRWIRRSRGGTRAKVRTKRRTIADDLRAAAQELAAAGIEDARLEAELLLAHLLGEPRLRLLVDSQRHLTEREQADYAGMVEARSRRVPLPYITGLREFFGLSFHVGPGVLIPRPETEVLVEAVLARLPHDRPVRILDIGSGTGCVAIALARSLPEAQLVAIDSSEPAILLTCRNAEKHGVHPRLMVLRVDFPEEIGRIPGFFDAVVSNPPYVPSEEIARLQPEISRYEPRAALDGGPDGLDFIRALLEHGPSLLKEPTGPPCQPREQFLAFEIGAGQADAVRELALGMGARRVEFIKDLAGIERVAIVEPLRTTVLAAERSLDVALECLRVGEPVAFPTETVYGLGAPVSNSDAVARLYRAKGREEDKPISLLVSDVAQVERVAAAVPESARRLMQEYFPGPLTIILAARPEVPAIVTAGSGKVGVRMPDHPVALSLIQRLGEPLATTSANRSGGPEPADAASVLRQLGGRIALILDGGPTGVGVPSTVVDLTETPPRILREGAIPREKIEAALLESGSSS